MFFRVATDRAAGISRIGFRNDDGCDDDQQRRQPRGRQIDQVIEPRRLYRQIADQLRTLIRKGEYAIGSRLPAERYAVGKDATAALDADGNPTTDPQAGLMGSMLPIGAVSSPKGAMLALVVELLVTALIGAQFGFEASSFFVDEGNQPRIGQAFLVIDPGALAGSDRYFERMETLIAEMLVDDGVRLAGGRRLALERTAHKDGIAIPDALHAQIVALAG